MVRTRLFIERVLLLFLGSYLSYIVTIQIMKQSGQFEMMDNVLDKNKLQLLRSLGINKNLLSNHEQTHLHNIISPDDINVSFNDIKGYQNVKDEIHQSIIKPLEDKSIYEEQSLLKPPNGIILYGPPGTGKTMFAKAIAKHLDGVFLNFTINTIENKMYGESSKILNGLFTFCDKIKPCVVFIDEIDGFFGERNILDQSFVTGLKTQMLTLLDGINERDPQILFIGATNKLQNIDKALKRRMRLHIKIDLPDEETREEIFKLHLKDFDLNFKNLAEKSNSFSGSDIHEVCKKAAHNTIIKYQELSKLDQQLIEDTIKIF
tara:strand:+ start:14112 stop:15068 length:957 start_codon:yes stop_codon:yes gene_type:complete